MIKKYSGWIAIISFISSVILAIVKRVTNNPADNIFVLTEWLLLILFYVGTIIVCRETN